MTAIRRTFSPGSSVITSLSVRRHIKTRRKGRKERFCGEEKCQVPVDDRTCSVLASPGRVTFAPRTSSHPFCMADAVPDWNTSMHPIKSGETISAVMSEQVSYLKCPSDGNSMSHNLGGCCMALPNYGPDLRNIFLPPFPPPDRTLSAKNQPGVKYGNIQREKRPNYHRPSLFVVKGKGCFCFSTKKILFFDEKNFAFRWKKHALLIFSCVRFLREILKKGRV